MNVGDIPTIRVTRHGEEKFDYGAERFGLTLGQIKATAHIVIDNETRQCHKCGTQVATYFKKPGSLYVWCLGCV